MLNKAFQFKESIYESFGRLVDNRSLRRIRRRDILVP